MLDGGGAEARCPFKSDILVEWVWLFLIWARHHWWRDVDASVVDDETPRELPNSNFVKGFLVPASAFEILDQERANCGRYMGLGLMLLNDTADMRSPACPSKSKSSSTSLHRTSLPIKSETGKRSASRSKASYGVSPS